RDLGTRLEAALQRGDVDRLGVRTEGLEGHRLLHVRPAQLSHAHVDRHLTAFEGRSALGARARARALLPTAGGLAGARAFAAPDALAGTTAAGRGRQVVQADALLLVFGGGAHLPSLTSTRWRTACSMPRTGSESLTSTVCPMRRRPSERSVSSCLLLLPFLDRRWVTLSTAIRRTPPRRAPPQAPPRRAPPRAPPRGAQARPAPLALRPSR